MKNIFDKKFVRYGIFLVFSLITYGIVSNITVVLTNSIDGTIMWNKGGTASKGDYVNYTLNPKVVNNEVIVVTKIVTCVEGDYLKTRNSDFYCNDKFIGSAKAVGRKGQVLTKFQWDGYIPRDKVFLSGRHIDSFDSRYWGFADQEKMIKVIKLI